jgi:tetraacyldisaccharide 4'-kinase
VGLPDQTPEFDLGDELEMLRRRGISVISCPDRVASAKRAIAEGARWLILDGGLEYPGLVPDLRIVCVDAQWPNSRGRIPVGERRSDLSWLGRADVIWVNHAKPPIPMPRLPAEVPVVRAWLEPDSWRFGAMDHPLSAVSGSVHAMAGIARPERFCCTLLRMGLDIDSWKPVGDHHSLGTLRPNAVITEKDAARLPQDAPVRVLKMTVKARGASAVLDRIRGLL